jgi:hypothetical protein
VPDPKDRLGSRREVLQYGLRAPAFS